MLGLFIKINLYENIKILWFLTGLLNLSYKFVSMQERRESTNLHI